MARLPMEKLFEVIHEDDGLLVVNKPAGLACHPTKGDAYSSLISRVRLHLAGRGGRVHRSADGPPSAAGAQRMGTVEVVAVFDGRRRAADAERPRSAPTASEFARSAPQLINRLDRETSGVVLVAKEVTSARLWRRRWEGGEIEKVYLAIVHGRVAPDEAEIDAPLGRDESSRVAIKDTVRVDGAAAQTGFRVLSRFDKDGRSFSLLKVRPLTGRKHQIRIHLAHAGHPIVGDKLYGGDEQIYLDFVLGRLSDEQRAGLLLPHQALHAQSVQWGQGSQEIRFEARTERWFREFLPSDLLYR